MTREYDPQLDSNGAIRSGNARIRELLTYATAAVTDKNFDAAESFYQSIASLASSLRESCEVRSNPASLSEYLRERAKS